MRGVRGRGGKGGGERGRYSRCRVKRGYGIRVVIMEK